MKEAVLNHVHEVTTVSMPWSRKINRARRLIKNVVFTVLVTR